jgi:hypothetical protein
MIDEQVSFEVDGFKWAIDMAMASSPALEIFKNALGEVI